jgi:hypothetical protein
MDPYYGALIGFTVPCFIRDLRPLRDFAFENVKDVGVHAATSLDDGPLPPQNYVWWVHETFERYRLPTKRMRYWASVIPAVPKSEPSWSRGFPHIHGWDGWTLVLYLSQVEDGGELVICDAKGTVQSILPPKLGSAVFIDGTTNHGVMVPYGSVDRVSLIATGYPE